MDTLHGSTACPVNLLVDLIGESKSEADLRKYERIALALRKQLLPGERLRISEAIHRRAEELARLLRDYASEAEERIL